MGRYSSTFKGWFGSTGWSSNKNNNVNYYYYYYHFYLELLTYLYSAKISIFISSLIEKEKYICTKNIYSPHRAHGGTRGYTHTKSPVCYVAVPNVGHVGVPNQFSGSWPFFLRKTFFCSYKFVYMGENALYQTLAVVHTIPDSFCAGTKIIPHRASVHTLERWFRCDFCNRAKMRRAVL